MPWSRRSSLWLVFQSEHVCLPHISFSFTPCFSVVTGARIRTNVRIPRISPGLITAPPVLQWARLTPGRYRSQVSSKQRYVRCFHYDNLSLFFAFSRFLLFFLFSRITWKRGLLSASLKAAIHLRRCQPKHRRGIQTERHPELRCCVRILKPYLPFRMAKVNCYVLIILMYDCSFTRSRRVGFGNQSNELAVGEHRCHGLWLRSTEFLHRLR